MVAESNHVIHADLPRMVCFIVSGDRTWHLTGSAAAS